MTGAAAVLLVALLAQAPISFTAGVSDRAERVIYHFANDSSFDSNALVPHYFEQRYTSARAWLTFDTRYPLFGSRATTSVSIAPRVRTAGSDIDTFMLPGGDVATSGTDGSVFLSSFAIRQTIPLAQTHGWTVNLSAGYRRSRADFPPDDRIVTHTQPASLTRTFTTDRETTFSHVIDMGVLAGTERRLGDRWLWTLSASASPMTRARLVTQLPDKYPGLNIVFDAIAFGCSGSASLARSWRHAHAGIGVDAAFARGYRRTADYRQRALDVMLFLRLVR